MQRFREKTVNKLFDDTWQHEFTFVGFFIPAASDIITVNKANVFNKPLYHNTIHERNNDNEWIPQGSGGNN